MQMQTKEQISIVCRELLKGGALSIGKLIEERAPPPCPRILSVDFG